MKECQNGFMSLVIGNRKKEKKKKERNKEEKCD